MSVMPSQEKESIIPGRHGKQLGQPSVQITKNRKGRPEGMPALPQTNSGGSLRFPRRGELKDAIRNRRRWCSVEERALRAKHIAVQLVRGVPSRKRRGWDESTSHFPAVRLMFKVVGFIAVKEVMRAAE